jgi:hypothetical protein
MSVNKMQLFSGQFLVALPAFRFPPRAFPLGRWDGSGTETGTDAKSQSPVFTGLGTMLRLYTPKVPPSPLGPRPPFPKPAAGENPNQIHSRPGPKIGHSVFGPSLAAALFTVF